MEVRSGQKPLLRPVYEAVRGSPFKLTAGAEGSAVDAGSVFGAEGNVSVFGAAGNDSSLTVLPLVG